MTVTPLRVVPPAATVDLAAAERAAADLLLESLDAGPAVPAAGPGTGSSRA